MSVSLAALESLREHWAISAISREDHDRASIDTHQQLARSAVGGQIDFAFPTSGGVSVLKRVAIAYDLAAIEGLDELSRPAGANASLRAQAEAAAFRSFDIRRLLPVPSAVDERLFFVLRLSALAYCGDRWSDLSRWFNEHPGALQVPSVAGVDWDRRLLYRIFDSWIRLFRKDGWDDLDRIREIIAGLRMDQARYEPELLENIPSGTGRSVALRLIALYHWAKATEILACYMLEGKSSNPFGEIDKHFESGIKAATASGDPQHEIMLRWLHATGRIMISNSLWWSTRAVNSRMSQFVHSLTHREHRPMFELLPPQRSALLEQGLLDPAKTAIVIDLPTSGGKTLLAEFRILQALNQFDMESGWVAYVAPTRSLAAQITRRFRKRFGPIDVRVEQLTGAMDVDAFEEKLLCDGNHRFHVLVATPEKLSLVIRNKRVERPLALVVMDEAHNLEAEGRGLRIELLLATVKRDCPRANFLLLMPYVEDADVIARWLAHDVAAGQAISLGTAPWKPNERIVGIYRAVADDSQHAGWHLEYETLSATKRAMPLRGTHRVGGVKPIAVPKSKVLRKNFQQGLGLQTAAIGAVLSGRGTSVSVANNIKTVWKMADEAAKSLPSTDVPDETRLVQDFLRTEVGSDFSLVHLLEKGVGVHHAGLSDEVRLLMEWLAEEGKLRMLCATSTIAQGINFPVSSVFLASCYIPSPKGSIKMAPREFWNLAGRAGRIGHDSVGVIGISAGNRPEEVKTFVSQNTGAFVSRLVSLLDDLSAQGKLAGLSDVLWQDQWDDLRCYIAHLWADKRNLDAVLDDSEQILRQTYGYTALRNDPKQHKKAEALLEATRSYIQRLAKMPDHVLDIAESTGFTPEGVIKVRKGLNELDSGLAVTDWLPESLFGTAGRFSDLVGVMLKIPQLQQFEEIQGSGSQHVRISEITRDWVNGKGLAEIATAYFGENGESDFTVALSDACKAIYRVIVNSGTWGISALSQASGLDFETLPVETRRKINALPAMIYHGVRTEEAVLMRMNAVPRSVAESLGRLYRSLAHEDESRYTVGNAREFLRGLDEVGWERARPANSRLSGARFKRVWSVLSGELE